jgi:acyl-lipid omega-6 desaturase (Delta-12 desaturase)
MKTLTRAPTFPAELDPTCWRALVRAYEAPQRRRSVLQLATTLVLLAIACTLSARTLSGPYWITFLIAIPTAFLIVRSFIIMHDCAHGSYFKSRLANDVVGFITGAITLTPYVRWRREHVLHHATTGDLDRRGEGDTWTMTVKEYRAASSTLRFRYRLYRTPLVFLLVGPIKYAIDQRLPPTGKADTPQVRASVRETNLALLAILLAGSALIGPLGVLLVYAPAYEIAMGIGAYIIWVQHQFEDTYWAEHESWDYTTAALRGSSYLKLPRVLDWLTCSIGLHHLHHLSPRIPNYRLRECHEAHPMFREAHVITLRESRKAVALALWDEEKQKLVGFDAVDLHQQSSQRVF